MLNRSSRGGTVHWGTSLVLAAAFATLPLPALAAQGLAGGSLVSLNGAGSPSADDPRIPLTPPPPLPPALTPAMARDILVKAAQGQGVDPNLLLAVSFRESSWKQDAVSSEGAIGLLQVMPKTAAVAGPRFLGRSVNLEDPVDNAALGAALLKDLLDKYPPRTALAAYYQGEPALLSGQYAADTWQYADGILQLTASIAAGQGPSAG